MKCLGSWQGAGLILGQLLLCNGWDLGWTPTVISQQHRLYISLICYYYYILLYSGPSQVPNIHYLQLCPHQHLISSYNKNDVNRSKMIANYYGFG